MGKRHLVRAWGQILRGGQPSLSIEITRECPLRCPGCYAYEPGHLGDAGPLRSLADFKGQALIDGVMGLVERHRPVHVSIVGGEPLVRHKELDVILPRLSARGIMVQLVTSAVRPIPSAWHGLEGLQLVVSIDGLQPEHDKRRAPATYERILKHVEGHSLYVHCTITSQMAQREGSLREFLAFWSQRPEIKRIWFSLFTPQQGHEPEEVLSPEVRAAALAELARLRPTFPKIYLPDGVIAGYLKPPKSPADCIFARTTACVSADLMTAITPCQFGGAPDCTRCGCLASAGLNALADRRVLGVPLRTLYVASERIGRMSRQLGERFERAEAPPRQVSLTVLGQPTEE
jgi:MoaA/NifB/PqqE/SkfB family radical SAM enzyme